MNHGRSNEMLGCMLLTTPFATEKLCPKPRFQALPRRVGRGSHAARARPQRCPSWRDCAMTAPATEATDLNHATVHDWKIELPRCFSCNLTIELSGRPQLTQRTGPRTNCNRAHGAAT